jgi:hypothetical protein
MFSIFINSFLPDAYEREKEKVTKFLGAHDIIKCALSISDERLGTTHIVKMSSDYVKNLIGEPEVSI